MENELTGYQNLADNVVSKTMDENQEVEQPKITAETKKEEEGAVEQRLRQQLNARQERVRKAWEAALKAKRERGERVTREEEEEARKAAEKGEYPRIAGASDGFENLNPESYAGSSIEQFARLLKTAGERGNVTEEFLQDVQNRAQASIRNDNDQQKYDMFVGDVNQITNRLREATAADEELPGQLPQDGAVLSIEDILRTRVESALRKKEARSSNPRSIQEVALSIINDEGPDRWGPGGTFPLVEEVRDASGKIDYRDRKIVDANGVERTIQEPRLQLNQKNFLRWFRERMMYHHSNNSRDETLQLGNLVGITSEFGSTISIFNMDKDRGQYFRDENGGPSGEVVILDKLADQMKYELWLFGNMRNYDLLYQKYMSSDSDLPKFLQNVHDKEEITQPRSLEIIMTMPKEFGEGDTEVGDAVRKAYEIYYNASDLEMLKRVVGKDSSFFTKEGFINAFRIIDGKGPNATFEELNRESQAFINNLFNGDVLDENKFINQMNPFNEKNKAEFNKKIIREMVRQVIAEKYNLDYGFDPKTMKLNSDGSIDAGQRDLVRKELEYAEAFAWVLTRWTGAAARNDTQAIGFDAFTKTMKTRAYRLGQSGINRAAPIGNEYDLGVFKGLTMDFFNGVTVEKRIGDQQTYTPFEIFQIMSQIEDDTSMSDEEKREKKDYWAKRLNFEQYIQRSYAADHINRGFEVFHSVMGAEELHLEEIVKWDPFRGIILDRAKFEEQVKEKFLKPIRYAFRTYAQLDLGKTMRMQVGGYKAGETPIYRDATMAEVLFGPEVLADIRLEALKHHHDKIEHGEMSKDEAFSRFLSSQDGKNIVWKRAAMSRIAALMKSHRQFANGYTPFTAGMVETFYDALKTIKEMDLVDEEEGTDIWYKKNFFTHEDMEWMRKKSGTTERDLFIKDFLIKGMGVGIGKGIGEGISLFVKDIFK